MNKIIYKIRWALLGVLAFISNTGYSAEVSLMLDYRQQPVIHIDGMIKKGDLAKLKSAIQKSFYELTNHSPIISLNSAGGDVEEAMKIGRFIRQLNMEVNAIGVIIDRDTDEEIYSPLTAHPFYTVYRSLNQPITDDSLRRCFSACVLIFYGGAKRFVRDNSDNRVGKPGTNRLPVIGLHRPYFVGDQYPNLKPDEARKAYQKLTDSVSDYLLEMGATNALVERMFQSGSDEIDLVPEEEFRDYFNKTEPYLEEWLKSKCDKANPEQLTSEELTLLEKVSEARSKQIKKIVAIKKTSNRPLSDVVDEVVSDVHKSYLPDGIEADRYHDILGRVKRRDDRRADCRDFAIAIHQQNWAINYESGAPISNSGKTESKISAYLLLFILIILTAGVGSYRIRARNK